MSGVLPEADSPERDEVAEETALLVRLRAGEDSAYEQLVSEYGGRMLAVTRRFLANEEASTSTVEKAKYQLR